MARSTAVPGCLLALVLALSILQGTYGHGFMQVPASRNYIANRQGREYCHHCLSSGGPGTVQPLTPGGLFPATETITSAVRHTMCGEPATTPASQRVYNPAPIPSLASLPVYAPGAEFDVTVQVTAHHRGHFEFRLCDASKLSDPKTVTWACLDQHVLQRVPVPGEVSPVDVNYPERYYLEPECAPNYNKTVFMKYRMPAGVTCERCVIQWWWITANSCNPPGYAGRSPQPAHVATGCQWWQSNLPLCSQTYPEEFWNCADVRIAGTAAPQPAIGNTEPPAAPKPVAAPVKPAVPPAQPVAPPAQPVAPPAQPVVPPAVPVAPAQPSAPVAPGASECPDYDNSNANQFNAASPLVGYVGGNNVGGWKWTDPKWAVYDMLVVAFVTRWSLTGPCGSAGLWAGLPGYPNLITSACGWSAPTTCDQVVNCVTTGAAADMGAVGVAKFQDKGRRKVIISLGGANADATFTNAAQGTRLAEVMWELYLGGTNASYAPFRPFGQVVLDGVDLDLEQHAGWNTETTKGWGNFVTRMRQLMDQDARKAYYIVGAPINPTFSDDWGGQEQYGAFRDVAPCSGSMGVNVALPAVSSLTVSPQNSFYGHLSAVDYVFPQFYNTPEHNLCAGNSATGCTVPAGKCYRYDFRVWTAIVRMYGGGRTRLVLGLPLSTGGAGNGFVPASILSNLVSELLTSFPESQEVFGGFMGWELFNDQEALYANQLRSIAQQLQAAGLVGTTWETRPKAATAGCAVGGVVRDEPPAAPAPVATAPAPAPVRAPAPAPAPAPAVPVEVAVPADASCAKLGWQCGGSSWTGPTCCQQGECLAYIPQYSECRTSCPPGWLCNQQTTPPVQPAVPPAQPAVPPAQPVTPPAQPVAPKAPPAAPKAPPAAPKAPPAAPKAPPAAPKAPPAAPKAPPAVPPTAPQPVSQTCAANGYQCGGNGWTGTTCCQSGTTCYAYISTYSQCRTGSCPPGWLCNNDKSLMTQAVDFVKTTLAL